MSKEEIEEKLIIGAKIKIGEEYAFNYGFEPFQVIELIEGYFDEYNGLYETTVSCPGVWNEDQKEYDSIYHLFGNDLENFMDCEILENNN